MVNVWPDELSPWPDAEPSSRDDAPGFRVVPENSEPDVPGFRLPPDDSDADAPGFRVAPDHPGSTPSGGDPFSLPGYDPSANTMPSFGIGYDDATPAGTPPTTYLPDGQPVFAPFRDPMQAAFDQLGRIHSRAAGMLPARPGPEPANADQIAPAAEDEPFSPYTSRRGLPPSSSTPSLPETYFRQYPGRDAPPGGDGSFADDSWPALRLYSSEPSESFLEPVGQAGQETQRNGDAPLHKDWSREVPMQNRNVVDDPQVIHTGTRDGKNVDSDVLVAQSQPTDKIENAPPERVEGPLDALGHYIGGSGKSVEYRIGQIDTNSVEPDQFPAVKDILRQGKPGTYKIQGKMPFSTPNFNSKYLIGNITLDMDGTLVLDDNGKYSFTGTLGAAPDTYRFYSSNHRDSIPELATRFGELLPGHEFTVNITGRKSIWSNGSYRKVHEKSP